MFGMINQLFSKRVAQDKLSPDPLFFKKMCSPFCTTPAQAKIGEFYSISSSL